MSTDESNENLSPQMLQVMAEVLAAEAPEVTLPPVRKEALWHRIVNQVETLPPPGTITVRAQEGKWHPFLPGVDVKILHRDAVNGTQTALWRMQPGSKLPAHPHRIDEECLVLEGSIRSQAYVVHQGDFHLALAGQHHTEIFSDHGALLLIRSEIAHHYTPQLS